jgi:UDP-N-acetylglucosamine 2-epimerase (non-hydrolysing)
MGNKKLIYIIAGARPNFMKIAPLYHALINEPWADPRIIHTGQHYDVNMSDLFFKDLKLPMPHMHLGVGSGTHAEQTGRCMMEFEKVALKHGPNLTVVVGDVNSTMACTIAAVKTGHRVGHLVAGLRSFDRNMPEEINRIVTDALADMLWTPSADADENLLREGVAPQKIRRVGNIMMDSLEMLRTEVEQRIAYGQFGLTPGSYGVVTLHRPSNVDEKKKLEQMMSVRG